jgi:hypothetical protein
MSVRTQRLSLKTPIGDAPSQTGRAPPPPPPAGAPGPPSRPSDGPSSPRSPTSKRASYFNSEQSPTSPITPGSNNRRASKVPPIPGAAPTVASGQTRAPPPPPPPAVLSRSSTGDARPLSSSESEIQQESQQASEGEVTEYEGDYDTDIASAAPHKDALKSHGRVSSYEDSTPVRSPTLSPSSAPPPLPLVGAPRAVPPPLPSQPPPNSRQSVDMPRAAPPPPPPPKEVEPSQNDEEYDPFNYAAPVPPPPSGRPPPPAAPQVASPTPQEQEDDLYTASPIRTHPAPPQPVRQQTGSSVTGTPPSRSGPRPSADFSRTQASGRRSTELGRMSMDTGYMANDIDLGYSTKWWTQPNALPSALQGRRDILHETEESQDGAGTVTRHLFVLYPDYSQTIITAVFSASNPAQAELKQRHEQPPPRLRQDQLEEAWERFGRRIASEVAKKKDTVVSTGSPEALVHALLAPFTDALRPVGTRAYGALIYGNLANASTQQNDEIRPGDIITLRNAKFQGKHGPMHAKYSIEVGKGDGHVGVVSEWDGTKKKVRAWEQGRESKKCKVESFKLDDLRSGECKIWRVMPRSWVGWEGNN